jgi:broad specificity phosphatase PhoE
MKPLYIYITRHGQTVFNIIHTVQGWNDSPLTEAGIFQGKCVGYGLRNIRFNKAYSGDIDRQYQTVELVLQENKYGRETELVLRKKLREMGYGTYEGKPYEIMLTPVFERINVPFGDFEKLEEKLSPAEIGRIINENNDTSENYEVLCTRVKEAIEQIVRENIDGGNVLVATSSCAIDALIDVLFPELEKRKGLVSNCCICLIRYEKKNYYLDKFNDISYRIEGERHYQKKGQ